MLKGGESHENLSPEESEFLREASTLTEYQIDREEAFLINNPPVVVLFRHPPHELDMDRIYIVLSATASRVGHVIELENRQIMSEILDEAIFMVNYTGKIEPGFTDICLKMFKIQDKDEFLETQPGELFYGTTKEAESFQEWIELCFNGLLEFDDVRNLQPTTLTTADGRLLELAIFPIYDQETQEKPQLHYILFQLKDITLIQKQEKNLEHFEESNLSVIRVIQHQAAFNSYLQLIQDHFAHYEATASLQRVDLIRALHTAKGTSGVFKFKTIQQKCHDAETFLKEGRELSPGSDVALLILSISEFLKTFLEENKEVLKVVMEKKNVFTVDRNWYQHIRTQFSQRDALNCDESRFLLEQMTYVPLTHLFTHFNMMLEDLAISRGKMLQPLVIQDDEGIFVPEGVLNPLINSISHILRNAVDHGIEEPDIRWAEQKEPEGRIQITFHSESGHLSISIVDDGKGINLKKLPSQAVAKGFITPEQAEGLTEEQTKQLIFLEGFSTKETADMVSGRGVGMKDVLKSCQLLGGQLDFETVLGKGTTWEIKIPLTSIYGKMAEFGNFSLNSPKSSLQEAVRE
ncbi:ATP-binding protein [Deltaproteobacteria bacterium TL4]